MVKKTKSKTVKTKKVVKKVKERPINDDAGALIKETALQDSLFLKQLGIKFLWLVLIIMLIGLFASMSESFAGDRRQLIVNPSAEKSSEEVEPVRTQYPPHVYILASLKQVSAMTCVAFQNGTRNAEFIKENEDHTLFANTLADEFLYALQHDIEFETPFTPELYELMGKPPLDELRPLLVAAVKAGADKGSELFKADKDSITNQPMACIDFGKEYIPQ